MLSGRVCRVTCQLESLLFPHKDVKDGNHSRLFWRLSVIGHQGWLGANQAVFSSCELVGSVIGWEWPILSKRVL